jgi:hypothetical protein
MNVSQIKALTWLVAVGLTGGLFWYVFTFFSGLETRDKLFDDDRAREVLSKEYTNDGPKVDVVALTDVQRTFQQLNWTGKEEPKQAEVVVPDVPKEQPKTPVADLIRVVFVQEDEQRPENSLAHIAYRDSAGVTSAPKNGLLIAPGDRLAAPHQSIRLEKIDGEEGLTFVFDEEGREPETILVPTFDVGAQIVNVGPDGAILPPKSPIREFSGPRGPVSRQTQRIGKDRFALGTEDMFLLGDNFPTIVAREVRYRRHRDPKTGKYDGIELQEVEASGTVARHGGQSGDVIKSINGTPVTQLSEAITFVKNNKDKYSTWEVVVENRGQTRTVIYETPPSQP